MGELYTLARMVNAELEVKHPDAIALMMAKGRLASQTGFLVSAVQPSDPDDPERIVRLRNAARDLGIAI